MLSLFSLKSVGEKEKEPKNPYVQINSLMAQKRAYQDNLRLRNSLVIPVSLDQS